MSLLRVELAELNWSKAINPLTDLCKTDRNIWVTACTLGIREKEIRESFDFTDRVHELTKGKRVLEIGCGHGLVGSILIEKGYAKTVTMLDKRITKANSKIISALNNHTRLFFNLKDAADPSALENLEFDAVIGVHACGDLTDTLIDIAIRKGASVAVATCCMDKLRNPKMRKYLQIYGELGVEIKRVQKLMDAGYEVSVRSLKSSITPKNRIIMGKKK